jgi:hypothetical protein
MPIIPPGSVYSPGDDTAESLAIIGGSIPAIVDPRRGVRERAFEIMQDPMKIEAFAKRAYAESLSIGPDDQPFIDNNKRQQIIRDFAVTLGLDPNNEREFSVIGPILDSAMSALPGSTRHELEYNLLSKNRGKERERMEVETQAAIDDAKTKIESSRAEAAFTRAYSAAGGPEAEAGKKFLDLQNETTIARYFQDGWEDWVTAAGSDPVLDAYLMEGDMAGIAKYLQALEIAKQKAINGQVAGIEPREMQLILSGMHSDLSEARKAIDEAMDIGSKRAAVEHYRGLLDNYNQIRRMSGIEVTEEPIPYVGSVPAWGGLLGEDDQILWRTTNINVPTSMDPVVWRNQLDSVELTIKSAIAAGEDLVELQQELYDDIRIEGLLDRLDKREMRDLLDVYEAYAGRNLPLLRKKIRDSKPIPQLPEKYSAIGLLINPGARETHGITWSKRDNQP